MLSYAAFLTEGLETWYHGSNTKLEKFNLDHLGTGQGADQEGPGIYLTSSFEDAKHYGRFIHTVQAKVVKSKLIPEKRKSTLTGSKEQLGKAL